MDITEELENLESELDLDTIIETFPFERVHELMVKSDWRWYITDGFGVPSIESMKELVSGYIQEMKDHPEWRSIGSGGFTVYRDQNNQLKVFFGI